MKPTKIAVIGLGVMGQTHARIYAEMEGVELVAVHDANREHADTMAKKFGVMALHDAERLFARDDLDAVSICTSDDHHYALAELACRFGKHVLMEKPLATDLKQAEDIVNQVKASGIKMMVGHTLRWDPRYYHAKESVRSGGIGKPLHLFARRNNSFTNGSRLKGRTSVLMFLGVHDIDAIEWITGDKITEVYTVDVRHRMASYGVSDAAVSTLRFASGAVGLYETSWVLPDHYTELDAKLDIIGTEGAVNINIFGQNITVHSDSRPKYPDTMYGVDLYGKMTGIMTEEISCFVRAVRQNEELPISVEEAYRAVYIAHCMEQSLATKSPVQVGS